MDLKVDITKLTESPYSSDNKSAFHFEDDDRMESISLELQNAHPSCYLISGYRGVGKTSFVNRVIENVKGNTVCASLNLAKYDGYPKMVKKLIRELYNNFQQTHNDLIKSDPELVEDFNLLYDRTFHEVSSSQKATLKKEWSLTTTLETDLKEMLMPLAVFFISFSNLIAGISSIQLLNWGAAIVTSIWLAVKTFKLVTTLTRSKTNVNEQVRKSLYDDEIAEHHLINILKRLNNQGIKILISLDEIDKMQDVAGAIKTLDDLKPLLLSGYANFFIVAGQSLFYEYECSAQKENEAISTLFSRIVHISFLKNAALKRFCLGLLMQPELKTESSVNEYFDSLMLNSSRIPRKLVNLIRSKLIWKESKPHLSLDETRNPFYAYESRLLACLTALMDNQLPSIARNDVQLDFFIAQIFLWVARMRDTDGIVFKMSTIIKQESYDYVPRSYVAQLWGLGQLLTDELVDRNFIVVRRHDFDDEQEDAYVWMAITQENTNEAAVSDEEPSPEQPEPDPADNAQPTSQIAEILNSNNTFVLDFIALEALVMKIWTEVNLQEVNKPVKSFNDIIEELVAAGILSHAWYRSSKLLDILKIRNALVHGVDNAHEARSNIQAAQFNLRRLHGEIIESYLFYVCRKTLIEYEVTKDNRGGFDFIAQQSSLTLTFDVKSFKSRDMQLEAKSLLEKFRVFRETTRQNCYYIVICFQTVENIDPERYNRFNETFVQNYSEGGEFVEIIYLLENNALGIGRGLAEALIDIESSIEKDDWEEVGFFTLREKINAEDIIKEESQKSWPDDFEMQLSQQKNQKKAFEKLSNLKIGDLSNKQFSVISNKAKKEWPRDFEMQLNIFEGQKTAIKMLDKLSEDLSHIAEFDDIVTCAKSNWPEDYVMQVHQIQNQTDALLAFNAFAANDVDRIVFDKIKYKAATEWPNDYEMQFNSLQTQIASYKELNK